MSASTNDVVIYIITADDCKVCINFKQRKIFDRLEEALKARGYEVKIINFPKMEGSVPKNGPNDVMTDFVNKSLNGWFPLFAVTHKGMESNSSKFTVDDFRKCTHLFNGKFVGDTVEQTKKYSHINVESIKSFVGEYLASKEFKNAVDKHKSKVGSVAPGSSSGLHRKAPVTNYSANQPNLPNMNTQPSVVPAAMGNDSTVVVDGCKKLGFNMHSRYK